MPPDRCPACGTPVQRRATVCPACGEHLPRPSGGEAPTPAQELVAPAQELAAPALELEMPVAPTRSPAPRRPGAPARMLLLGLGSAALGAAAGLFAAGHWPWALVLLAVALLLLVAFGEAQARAREPHPPEDDTAPDVGAPGAPE